MSKVILCDDCASYETLADALRSGIGISITLRQTKDREFFAASKDILPGTNIPISTLIYAEALRFQYQGQHIAALNHLLALFSMGSSILFPNGKSLYSFLVLHCEDLRQGTEDLDLLYEKISWLDPTRYALIGLNLSSIKYLRSKNNFLNIEEQITTEVSSKLDIICVPDIHAGRTAVAAQKDSLKGGTVSAHLRFLKKVLSFPMSKVFYLFYKKILERLLMDMLGYLEGKTGTLITYQLRPLYAKDFTATPDTLLRDPSCAIVIQGPLCAKNDFTLETIRLYKKIFPGSFIILSTWDDEDPAYLQKISAEHIEIILNKKPYCNGLLNVNLQLTSSRNGIQKAKELGARFSLKTRSDQRIYNKNIFESMTNMLDYFPPSERSGQNKRLVILHNSGKYSPYAFSDIFMFGDTDDMLSYWSAPLLEEDAAYTLFTPEGYLATTFLRKNGWLLDWTIENWWDICQECVITLDWTMIDLFFYKYDHFHHMQHQREYKAHVPADDLMPFTDWFNIFSNRANKKYTSQQMVQMRGFSPQE